MRDDDLAYPLGSYKASDDYPGDLEEEQEARDEL